MERFKVENIEAVKKILADIDHLDEKGYWPNTLVPEWVNAIIKVSFHNYRVNYHNVTVVAYRACVDYLLTQNGK